MNRRSLSFWLGAGLVSLVVAVALLAAFWTPYDPLKLDFKTRLAAPGWQHWMGTDELGRDVLSRLMRGTATSIRISLSTVFLATFFGVLIGALSGYLRGWPDRILMAINDALLAFPGLLMALGLLAVFGASTTGIIIALALAYASSVVRVVRGTVLGLRERDFVRASRVMGNAETYTLLRHVLPNCIAPVIVMATSMCGWIILAELAELSGPGRVAASTHLGQHAGGQPLICQPGGLAGDFPGLAISLALLGINLLGDALRDRLDPRMRRRV